jgi:ATP-dependent protease ClpP protease subunit
MPAPAVSLKTWFAFKRTTNEETGAPEADLDIFGRIGSFDVNAADFVAALRALGVVSVINVHMNTPGGSVIDGNSIYNVLLAHAARVVMHIDFAASMGTVIAMAGDEIQMAENGFFMIHDPSICTCGGAEDLRKDAELLEKIKANILRAYGRHANLTADEIAQLMTDETWFTAEEAKAKGFIHEISHESTKAAAMLEAHKDAFGFLKAPKTETAADGNGKPNKPAPASTSGQPGDVAKPPAGEGKPDKTPPANGDKSQLTATDEAYAAGEDAGRKLGHAEGKAEAGKALEDQANEAIKCVTEARAETAAVRAELQASKLAGAKLTTEKKTLDAQVASLTLGFHVDTKPEALDAESWKEAIDQLVAGGMAYGDAAAKVREERPDLFDEMIEAANQEEK